MSNLRSLAYASAMDAFDTDVGSLGMYGEENWVCDVDLSTGIAYTYFLSHNTGHNLLIQSEIPE